MTLGYNLSLVETCHLAIILRITLDLTHGVNDDTGTLDHMALSLPKFIKKMIQCIVYNMDLTENIFPLFSLLHRNNFFKSRIFFKKLKSTQLISPCPLNHFPIIFFPNKEHNMSES